MIIVGNRGYRIVNPVRTAEMESNNLAWFPDVGLIGSSTVDGNRLFVTIMERERSLLWI